MLAMIARIRVVQAPCRSKASDGTRFAERGPDTAFRLAQVELPLLAAIHGSHAGEPRAVHALRDLHNLSRLEHINVVLKRDLSIAAVYLTLDTAPCREVASVATQMRILARLTALPVGIIIRNLAEQLKAKFASNPIAKVPSPRRFDFDAVGSCELAYVVVEAARVIE